jgi:hypothetical protein
MLLIVIALFHQNSFATVYKCKTEAGKIEYQASPCAGASNLTQSTLPSVPVPSSQTVTSSGGKKKCTGNEMSIDFSNMPLSATLQVIADFSGNKLSVVPSIGGSGPFHYVCVPWDSVLKDIASKYNLSIVVESGTIIVRPH